jgi:4-diphosphocytidyl-2C-methyl-D-erythritol kinase
MKYKQCCKINLGLKVIGKRKDEYHDLKSVFIPVAIFDTLFFKKTKKDVIVKCEGIEQEDNLVYKVASLIKEEFSVIKGVEIVIKKRIPIKAGLGGGSADAAAAIKILNKLWKLELKDKEMFNLATKIGSDVPFFLYNKTAIVEGRGDIVTIIDTAMSFYVLILKPAFGLETGKVFQNLKLNLCKSNNIENVIQGIKEKSLNKISGNIINDLENGILYDKEKSDYIEKVKNDLLLSGAMASSLSGSGSCVFGIYQTKKEAKISKAQMLCKGYSKEQMYISIAGGK